MAEVIAFKRTELVNLASSTYKEYFVPHKDIFNDFYTFLAEIPRTLDMCALKEEVRKVLFRIFRATVATASENDLLLYQPPTYQKCLYEFYLQEMSRDIHQFYKIFEKNFSRLWYFLRSRKVLIDVMNELVKYFQFSESCNVAMLHATDCAKCSGYMDVQVCNNLCINIFRGCLVDFKEVGSAYNSLYLALQSLMNQMKYIFNPDHGFRSLHSGFLSFISKVAVSSTEIENVPGPLVTKVFEFLVIKVIYLQVY